VQFAFFWPFLINHENINRVQNFSLTYFLWKRYEKLDKNDKNQTLRTSIHSTKKDYQLLIFSKSKIKPNNLSFQNFLNRLKKTFHLKKKTAKKNKNTNKFDLKNYKDKRKKNHFFFFHSIEQQQKKIEPFFHELFHSARNFGPQR